MHSLINSSSRRLRITCLKNNTVGSSNDADADLRLGNPALSLRPRCNGSQTMASTWASASRRVVRPMLISDKNWFLGPNSSVPRCDSQETCYCGVNKVAGCNLPWLFPVDPFPGRKSPAIDEPYECFNLRDLACFMNVNSASVLTRIVSTSH